MLASIALSCATFDCRYASLETNQRSFLCAVFRLPPRRSRPDGSRRLAHNWRASGEFRITIRPLQFDHYNETLYEGKADPLFLILWKGSNATVTLNFDKPSIAINGHIVKASFEEQSVYLLRRDYSLERVDTDREKVFELFLGLPRTNIPSVWTEKIAPRLETIP